MTLATVKEATLKYAEAKRAENASLATTNSFRQWVDANFPGEGLPLSCNVEVVMNKVRAAASDYTIANVNTLKEVGAP